VRLCPVFKPPKISAPLKKKKKKPKKQPSLPPTTLFVVSVWEGEEVLPLQ
jgi:hypothetical protein